MAQESYSLDVGESLEEQQKAKKQIEEQKKLEEQKKQAEKKQEEEKKENKLMRVSSFLTKYHKFIIIILIILLISINVYIRVFALSAPGLDKLIEMSYEKTLKQNIANAIVKEHVGPVDQALLQKEIEKRYQTEMENPKQLAAMQKMQNAYRQVYFDPNGNRYFTNSDPFFYLRYAKNILKHGGMGEKIKDGAQFDDLRVAPYGSIIVFNLMSYYEAVLYKILSFFDSSMALEGAVNLLPIIISTLSAILVFFIIKRLTNAYGGFVGSLLFIVHPIVFSTTTAPDTQVPSVFLTLLTIWLVIEILFAKRYKIRFWILLAALFLTLILYKYTWSGYYYIYAIIASYAIFYACLVFIRNRFRKEKIDKRYLLGLLAVTILGVAYLAIRPRTVEHILSRLNIGVRAEFFPTAFSTVTELQRMALIQLIEKMGGHIFFTAAILTLIYLIYYSFRNKLEGNARFYLFMVYWFLGLLVVTLLSQRFIAYFSIPFMICIGIGAGLLYPCFEKIIGLLNLHEYKRYMKPAMAIFLILFMIFMLKGNIYQKIYSIPAYTADDALYEVSMDIKSQSKGNAIINTWWDDGYLLEYYAERPVLFDGGSFNSPALYWLSKAFVSTNSNYSINVLRMLDCGASGVFDEISAKKGGPEAIVILNKILEAGKSKSGKIIKEEKLDAGMLDRIFCKPPEAFFMVSERLVRVFSTYEVFAGWDFSANEIKSKITGMNSQEAVSFLEKEYNLSIEDAYDLYGKVYADADIMKKIELFDDVSCVILTDGVKCQGLSLDLKSNTAKDGSGEIFPYYYITQINGTNVTKNLSIDNSPTIMFYQEQDRIKVAALNSEVRDSFLLKTYFLNAYDIPQLELISQHSSLLGAKVKAYKINWTN